MILFIGISFLVSCNKSNDIDNNSLSYRNANNYFNFSQNEIDSIGINHNIYLLNGIGDLKTNSLNLEEKLYNQFIEIGPEFSIELIDSILMVGQQEFEVSKYFTDNRTIEIYNTLIEISNLDLISKYDNYVLKIDSLYSLIGSLSDSDKEFLKVCFSVAKNSTKLWLDKEKGGQGLFKLIHEREELESRLCWKCVVAGDVSGAAGVFMGWGVGLAIPGSNIAIAAAIGFGAAWGSATGAL